MEDIKDRFIDALDDPEFRSIQYFIKQLIAYIDEPIKPQNHE